MLVALMFQVLYVAIGVLVVTMIALAAGKNDWAVALMAASCFLLIVTVAVVNFWVPWLPNLPDASLFVAIIEGWDPPQHQSVGVRLYTVASEPLRYLSANEPGLFLVVQVVLYSLACLILLWSSFQRESGQNHNRLNALVFLVLCSVFPAAIFFVGSFLREYWVFLALSILSVSVGTRMVSARLIYFALGLLLIAAVRPHFLVFAPLFLIGASKRSLILLTLIGPVLLILGAWMFTVITGYSLSPEFLAMVRNVAVVGYAASGHTYGLVEWTSYLDIAQDLPLLFLQFVLAPMPILSDVNPVSMRLYFLDSLYVSLAIVLSLIGLGKASASIRSLWFIALVGLLLSSVWEFFIGGAVRHRMPFIWLLLPAAAVGAVRILVALGFRGTLAGSRDTQCLKPI